MLTSFLSSISVSQGYDEIVALLLNADAPINCRVAEDESTPLHKACAGSKSGHLEAVKLLLDGGADVHALNKWRETPLLTAANHGQAGAVEALLRAGADPCKCTDTGWSPLSIAAYKGHNDVVKLLLDEGAPTEEADPTLSALLQAATKGLPDTVELLLRHGADHTVTTKKGDTALSILVEQNLIDAAVEMVTRYKASIPRCSRDRKKVQKARLLINLRVKQQQKDAKDAPHDLYHDDDDYSQDDLVDEGQNSKTDVIHGAQGTNKIAKMKNNNNNNNGKVSAEEQAKAAEEALLMELELEDAERNKQEKEANKKLAKKRKKKERERQLKKEQEEKRLAEERAEEEKRRQELHARELAEKAERDRAAAARKKQEQEYLRKQSEDLRNRQKEEERIKKLKKEEEARSSKALPKANSAVSTTPNGRKPRQESRNEDRAKASIPKGHSPQSQNSTTPRNISDRANPAVERKKRGWESLPSTSTASKSSPTGAKNSETIGTSVVATVASESGATPDRARESLDGKDAPAPSKSGAGTTRADGTSRDDVLTFLEPPAVTVFRREKVFELLHRCSLAHLSNDALGCVDDTILRIVLLRWIDRSAHDDSECFDMIIPSWKDSEKLISFFQRQFITESRRGVTNRTIPSMESLKEAGATMASYCQSLARSVHDFRHQAEKQLSLNWNDESVGMSCSEIVRTMGNPTVIIDWSKQSQIQLPTSVFLNLKQRYRGSPSRFLASTFVCKYLHDTIFLLGGEAPVDYKLLPATKEILSMQMGIDAEVWADPFSVTGSNRLWSRLRSIDQLFGGCEPFTFSDVNDHVLRVRGGSVLLLVPSDNMIASRYIRHAVDALLSGSSTALSFTIFLRPDCLIDGSSSVTVEHLYALDPRLTKHQHLISRVERLPPGRHAFFSEKLGSPRASSTGDLFVVLQNMMGKTRYPVSDIAVAQILDSMKYEVDRQFEPSMRAPVPFSMSAGTYKPNVHLWTPQSDFITAPSAALIPPSPLPHQTIGSIGAAESNYQTIHSSISDSFPSNNSPTGQRRSAPRRGRLFDLVDDGGDEDNMNDVVSGMLGTLNVDLFQSTGVQDVDIEAISLMGIGGSTTQSSPSTLNPRGSSSQGRFG
jgi:ankyrin repeat protein